MLKYSLYTLNLHKINENGLKANTTKIDGIAFRVGAHTQWGSRKLILNQTGSESHPQV